MPSRLLRLTIAFALSLGSCSSLTSPVERGSNALFDYIVVGGGNAGLTLASRLSENSIVRVAVIEAGTFYERVTGNESIIPGNRGLYEGKAPSITNPLVEWGFMITPQAYLNESRIYMKLSGCTALNAMNYERPNAGSMDLWAAMVIDSSYAWDNSLHYFQKSIDFTPPDMSTRFANSTPSYDPTVLASGGPLSLTHPNYAQPFSSWLAEAMPEVDIGHIPGFRSGRLTMAERISFQEIAARGVIVSDMVSNRTFDLLARREVIISAGAFQSPQMLMVSGVGPAGLLAEHEIPLVADRPGVGQNMHDHVLFGVSYGVDVDTAYALGEPEAAAEAATLYHEDQAGPLSNRWRLCCLRKTPAGLSWWLVGRSRASDWPGIQGLFPAYAGNFYNPYVGGPREGNYVTLLAILMSPQSRGNAHSPRPVCWIPHSLIQPDSPIPSTWSSLLRRSSGCGVSSVRRYWKAH
ncbi:hypothetical protein AN3960.2 [Aspergillus nidulans FGSC A4]|uniref:Glucose-methanol-choline oxidoreductase N-terminal domain-containing protein n=1 Tax=Emericella nidulans (strain FGSC A4 / ATCC 38163 / CBS 112.46 / NRRL 194 / M139) TaxID=227321 RepID=Q5B670_EMENI|nr:hypothetical protein [Aspergillus nidulans FGSC A4]EAA59269.1 hypothetical protein AN3960.2 [Aspergillus nidulans FGSC A4]CBF75006.1 TPA: conserved hypothetical protein [Aspergillus nidulans FGSC A4]|eukprot:XP_661564.1 hypothetical protein AN3960.2 [Aspergillus nidulans FGSC A4]